jgi:plasmid stabilization system protein ParE
VKRREVVFAPEARDDLWRLYEGIATAAGMSIALAYIERIETASVSISRQSGATCAMISAPACGSSASSAASP